MFSLKNKRSRICLWAMLISLAVLLLVFYATDDITGDKEFSQYTREDWSVAIIPLIIMGISTVSCLTFSLILLIPILRAYPALAKYVSSIKFSDIDPGTDMLIFDHNELKRACCHTEDNDGIWFTVKEYDLKAKCWKILEEGRRIDNADMLPSVLQEDYQYDRLKIYYNRH